MNYYADSDCEYSIVIEENELDRYLSVSPNAGVKIIIVVLIVGMFTFVVEPLSPVHAREAHAPETRKFGQLSDGDGGRLSPASARVPAARHRCHPPPPSSPRSGTRVSGEGGGVLQRVHRRV